MIQQIEFSLTPKRRGCHLVTREIMDKLPRLPKTGLLNIFVKHTSCALTINENADPDVRTDMDKIMDDIVKEKQPWYDHTLEGADDMPAHAKSSIFGVSLTIPITDGRLTSRRHTSNQKKYRKTPWITSSPPQTTAPA